MIPALAHDHEAEMNLCASVLRDPTRLNHARSIISPDSDFTIAIVRDIWSATCAVQDLGEEIDTSTVLHQLRIPLEARADAHFEMLAELMMRPVEPSTIDHWIELVLVASRKRRLRHLGLSILGSCNDRDPEEVLAAIASDLRSFDDRTRSMVITARDAAERVAHQIREMNETKIAHAFLTGVEVLDKLFYLKRTDMTVIAGRPGAGKSFLAQQVIRAVTANGGFGLYVSVEMPAEDLVMRASSAYDQFDQNVFRLPTDEETVDRAIRALTMAGNPNWRFTTRTDFETVMRIARDLRQRGELDVLVVDYLQRMKSDRDYGVSRDEQLGKITGGLKDFALHERVPVFAISSMSRPAKGKENKRPTMADLRESGNIESDADNIVLLHRTGRDTAEWIIEKGRAKEDRLVVKMKRAFDRGGWEEAPPEKQKEKDGKADAGGTTSESVYGEPDPFPKSDPNEDLFKERPAGR